MPKMSPTRADMSEEEWRRRCDRLSLGRPTLGSWAFGSSDPRSTIWALKVSRHDHELVAARAVELGIVSRSDFMRRTVRAWLEIHGGPAFVDLDMSDMLTRPFVGGPEGPLVESDI